MATTYKPGKVSATNPASAIVTNVDGLPVPVGVGVLIRADSANSGVVYIGFNAAANVDGSTVGIPLAADDVYLVTPDKISNDARNVFIYGSSGAIWHDLAVTVTVLPNNQRA